MCDRIHKIWTDEQIVSAFWDVCQEYVFVPVGDALEENRHLARNSVRISSKRDLEPISHLLDEHRVEAANFLFLHFRGRQNTAYQSRLVSTDGDENSAMGILEIDKGKSSANGLTLIDLSLRAVEEMLDLFYEYVCRDDGILKPVIRYGGRKLRLCTMVRNVRQMIEATEDPSRGRSTHKRSARFAFPALTNVEDVEKLLEKLKSALDTSKKSVVGERDLLSPKGSNDGAHNIMHDVHKKADKLCTQLRYLVHDLRKNPPDEVERYETAPSDLEKIERKMTTYFENQIALAHSATLWQSLSSQPTPSAAAGDLASVSIFQLFDVAHSPPSCGCEHDPTISQKFIHI